jgi:hypothetical protein
MKAKNYAIVNGQVRKNAINDIMDRPCDGTVQVTVSGIATKSAKQRGLQHIWYQDVVKSGLGGEHESAEDLLDWACKYKWCLPLRIIGSSTFADMYNVYGKSCKQDPVKMKEFVREFVHTEDLSNNEMATYLTKFRDYYDEMGVNLTDPDEFGWANLLEQVEEKAA